MSAAGQPPKTGPTLPGAPILILLATSRDAQLAAQTFQEVGWVAHIATSSQEFSAHLQTSETLGAVLLAEEMVSPHILATFHEFQERQPTWSDLPFLLLQPPGQKLTEGFSQVINQLMRGNVSILERPLRKATLIASLEVALRARSRQYQVRELLHEKEADVRRRDEFLAMLGHELRNPLAAIRYAIDLLDDAEPTSHQVPREVIHRQTRNLSRLVDDLLDVARVTRGKVSLERQPIELGEVVQKTIATLEAARRSANHSIIYTPSSEPLYGEGDPIRLEQIFTNLLYNAIKYTPTDGRIEVSVERNGDWGVISVSDNGIGMSEQLLPHIFDLFAQSEQAIDRRRGGLGIGLTLVRGLVELHDGQITAFSEGIGKGSHFEVRLPLRIQETPQQTSEAPEGQSGTRHIAIIEDNDDAREVLKILLTRDGHSVSCAGDGEEGLNLLLREQPQIALVDIGLPTLSGYEIAQKARTALGNSIRLVALTGYGQPEDAQKALDSGFDFHLTKPIAPPELREILSRL